MGSILKILIKYLKQVIRIFNSTLLIFLIITNYLFLEYGNIDCNTLEIATVGNKSTLTWSKPNFQLKNYSISISDPTTKSSSLDFVSSESLSFGYYDLEYEHE